MLTREITAVILSTVLAIALGIALFAGNSKDKLTWKQIIIMIITGAAAGVITWTYLKEGSPTKTIVRSILLYTFCATVFSKLIGRIINAFTNIPEKDIQRFGMDYLRRRAGLDKNEDNGQTEDTNADHSGGDANDNGSAV